MTEVEYADQNNLNAGETIVVKTEDGSMYTFTKHNVLAGYNGIGFSFFETPEMASGVAISISDVFIAPYRTGGELSFKIQMEQEGKKSDFILIKPSAKITNITLFDWEE